MNFNHLYYFYLFVREGSVIKAAKKLSISQPALSAQLRLFETNLGEKIFVRAGRKLELTEKGKVVFNYARQMFSLSDELWDEIKHPQTALGQKLHVGVSDEVGKHFVVDALAQLHASKKFERPPATLVQAGLHDELVERLKSRDLDVIFSNQPCFQDGIETIAQAKMPVLLACHTKHQDQWRASRKLTENNILGMIKLFSLKFVVPSKGLRLRAEIDRFFEDLKTSPTIVFEGDQISTVNRAILGEVGLAFMPLPYVQDSVRQGTIVVFGPKVGFWQHGLWVLARKSEPHRAVLQELGKIINRPTPLLELAPHALPAGAAMRERLRIRRANCAIGGHDSEMPAFYSS